MKIYQIFLAMRNYKHIRVMTQPLRAWYYARMIDRSHVNPVRIVMSPDPLSLYMYVFRIRKMHRNCWLPQQVCKNKRQQWWSYGGETNQSRPDAKGWVTG